MTNEGPQYDEVDVTPPATVVSEKTPHSLPEAAQATQIIDPQSDEAGCFGNGKKTNRPLGIIGALAATTFALAVAVDAAKGTEPAVKSMDGNRKTRPANGHGGSSGTGGAPGNGGTGAGGKGGEPPYQENACAPGSFSMDAKKEEMGEPGNMLGVCTFIPNADGTVRAIGRTVIDQNGIPQDCFFSDTWTGGDFIKIRGEADGNKIDPSQKGKIYLKNGKMCLFQANETPDQNSEAIILGEAPLHVKTEGKVMIKRETETDASTGAEKHFDTVLAVEGKSTIHQDGNNPPDWTIQPGDNQYRFQLDVNRVSTGCMITSPAMNGTEDLGGALMLCAGAAFYLLRRKKISANGSNL